MRILVRLRVALACLAATRALRIDVVESEELRRQRNRGELKSARTDRRWLLLMPEGLMPKGRRELKLGLQPMVERPSFRFALLLPDVIGAHCDFIFGCFRMRVGHKVFVAPEPAQGIATS